MFTKCYKILFFQHKLYQKFFININYSFIPYKYNKLFSFCNTLYYNSLILHFYLYSIFVIIFIYFIIIFIFICYYLMSLSIYFIKTKNKIKHDLSTDLNSIFFFFFFFLVLSYIIICSFYWLH